MVRSCPPWGRAALCAVTLTLCSACSSAPPRKPLDCRALLDEVRTARSAAPLGSVMTLDEATAIMRRNNPAIQEARANWSVAARVASVRTPPPNPEIALGPVLLWGLGVASPPGAGVESALSWAIPLAQMHVLQDHVNAVLREAAFAEAAAIERGEYLSLRSDYMLAALELERVAAWDDINKASEDGAAIARRLVDAGQATAIDVRLLDLTVERTRAARLAARGRANERRTALAGRMGLSPSGVVAPSSVLVPALDANVPDLDAVKAAVVSQHPDLAVLRAQYLVAEKQLRLEAGRAIPGFGFRGSYERELGVDRVGLPFALEIPIFDRNQPGIARACAERDRIRTRYVAALQRLLSGVETAYARLQTERTRLDVMQAKVQPASQKTVEAARASLEVGSMDPLRVVEVLRAERDVALEAIDARIDVYEAWAGLEQAAGVPLLHWPTVVSSAPAGGEGN